MGKTAEPNTPYCSGFTQGAIGGITTQNPPISYTRNGGVVTVSDATGVIGEIQLSESDFVEVSRSSAIPGTQYCGSTLSARLEWKVGLSDWAKNSENPPISYTTSFLGGGFAPTGEIITSGTIEYAASSGPINHSAPAGYAIVGGDDSGSYWTFFSNPNTPPGWQTQVPGAIGIQAYIEQKISESASGYITNIVVRYDSGYGDNLGTIFINWTYRKLEPTNDAYNVTINDASGQIFSREYNVAPTNFIVRCYDYDLSRLTYACEGECPSGTEFQCKCEASNTLTCYGWDPENENIFKPLFTTSITSG